MVEDLAVHGGRPDSAARRRKVSGKSDGWVAGSQEEAARTLHERGARVAEPDSHSRQHRVELAAAGGGRPLQLLRAAGRQPSHLLDRAVRQNKFRDPGDARVRASQLRTAGASDRHRLFHAHEGSRQTLLREVAEQAGLESQA